jgi:hypothetical protein
LLEKRGLKGCVMFDTNIMINWPCQLALPGPGACDSHTQAFASYGAFDTKDQEESNDELMVSTA